LGLEIIRTIIDKGVTKYNTYESYEYRCSVCVGGSVKVQGIEKTKGTDVYEGGQSAHSHSEFIIMQTLCNTWGTRLKPVVLYLLNADIRIERVTISGNIKSP